MADPVIGPVADGDLFKVTIVQRLYGQRLLNILWYRVSDAGGAPPDRWQAQIALANQINVAGGIIPAMQDVQTQDLNIRSVIVNSYRDPLERKPYSEVIVNLDGNVLFPAGDANTAASIEKRANVPVAAHPRYGIGRMQVGGVPSNAYTAGVFGAAYLGDLQTLGDELTENVTALAVTFEPVLVNTDGANFVVSPIFGAVARDTVRVMRRRTVGVGE